jgi:hypothetical protein
MNSYHTMEILATLRVQDLTREAHSAALAAQVGRSSRPAYRLTVAHGLRELARRIDPAVEPVGARNAWLAHS